MHSDDSAVIVIGGAGEVGRLFFHLFKRAGKTVIGVDRRARPADLNYSMYFRYDASKDTIRMRKVIQLADCVLVALPFDAGHQTLRLLLSLMSDTGALLVDTLSVKGPIISLAAARVTGMEYVSVNPLFAPSLGFAGRRVAIVNLRAGRRAKAFKALLRSSGAVLIPVSATEHDFGTAKSQVMIHALLLAAGNVIAQKRLGCLGFHLRTPVATAIYALIARVCNGNPLTYYDIQKHHPHAREVRKLLIKNLRSAERLLAKNWYPGICNHAFGSETISLLKLGDEIVKKAS